MTFPPQNTIPSRLRRSSTLARCAAAVLCAGAACAWFAPPTAARAEDPQPIFRTAFPLESLRNVDPSDAKVAARILIKRIVEEQGVTYSTDIPETKNAFHEGLRVEAYDFFLIFTIDYLRIREEIPMTPMLVGTRVGDKPLERFYFVAPKPSASADAEPVLADAIDSLRGGKLLVESGSGELPLIWLSTILADAGAQPADALFSEIETTSNVSTTLLPVFFGKASACIVSESAYSTMLELNPQIGRKLAIHAISDPLLIHLMCIRADYVEMTPGLIVDVSTSLHETPDGDQTLKLMRVNRLLPFQEAYLDNITSLLQQHAESSVAANTAATTPALSGQEP